MKYYLLLGRDEGETAIAYHGGKVPLYYEYVNAKRGRAYHCPRGKNETKEEHLARQEATWKIVAFDTNDLPEVFE